MSAVNRHHMYDPRGGVRPMCGVRSKLPLNIGFVIDQVTCKACQSSYWLWREKERRRAIKEAGDAEAGL